MCSMTCTTVPMPYLHAFVIPCVTPSLRWMSRLDPRIGSRVVTDISATKWIFVIVSTLANQAM